MISASGSSYVSSTRSGERYSVCMYVAAAVVAELHHAADVCSVGRMKFSVTIGSRNSSISASGGQVRRVVDDA